MFRRAPEPAGTTADERPGFLARLRSRLNRGNSWLTYDLADLFRGRKIDAAILEELETRLHQRRRRAWRRPSASSRRCARAWRAHELADVAALIARPARGHRRDPRARARSRWSSTATQRPFVILVVGVNGSGKTTTIGKLARRCAERGPQRDARRRRHLPRRGHRAAQGVGRALAAPSSPPSRPGADPGAVVFDALQAARARGSDVLLADTAGRLHSQSHLMEELKKVRRVIQRVDPSAPHEVLLVLDANQGQNALAQARQFSEAVGVTGLVLTKLDGTAKGGIVVAIAQQARPADPLHRRRRAAGGLRRVRRRRLRRRPGRGSGPAPRRRAA